MEALGYRLLNITELDRSPSHNVLWLTEPAFLRSARPSLVSIPTNRLLWLHTCRYEFVNGSFKYPVITRT
jgi:hypothetical protein